MNVFQKLWQNWAKFEYGKPAPAEMAWLNELNQAVFAKFEERLPDYIKLRLVDSPRFTYQFKDEDGVIREKEGTANTYRLRQLPAGSFEERVEAAVEGLLHLIVTPCVRTVFMYWPLYPTGNELHDGSPNRKYLQTRLWATGETVDESDESVVTT
jgi:hypothetical protein